MKPMPIASRARQPLGVVPKRQRGGAAIEYTIVAGILALVLIGDPHVIQQLADALRDAYTSFVYALSIAWI